jgi:threonine/homoserine/homoserine lactone efflux protein
MIETTQLWLFFGIVLGVVLLPGLDMAYVLATSLAGGRRAGFAAVGGIVMAGFGHVALAVLGIATVLALAPTAFNLLLVVGTLYVAWIGVSLSRTGVTFGGPGDAARSIVVAFRRGALTNLLNPKAYVFMLAIFPQFVRADLGPMWRQALVLGAIIAATQTAVYGAIALAAARVRAWLESRPRVLLQIGRVIGVALIACAVFTAVEGWQRLA